MFYCGYLDFCIEAYHLPKSEGLDSNYTEIDPTDGFPIGKTETIKPGTDYTIITDTSEDGESTTIDPNSGKEVNVPPSGAGC